MMQGLAMAKFYQTPEFRSKEREWYRRLSDTGFRDAEKTVGSNRVLKKRACNSYRESKGSARENKERYFEVISQNIHITSFQNEKEQFVLLKFAEGLSRVDIVREVRNIGISIHRNTVTHIIRRYEHLWGLRFWSLKHRKLRHD